MIRRFGTSAHRLALSRTKPIVKPVARAFKPAATATSSTTSTTSTNGGSTTTAKPRTLQNSDALKASAGARRTAAPPPAPPSNERTSEFSPRLVPELATQATSTPVSEVVDPQEVVSDIPDLESTEGLSEDWATSFQGLGSKPFEPRVVDILMAPVVPEDVEVTPDGLIYLPEIKYRRILNRAFGPGGWGIAPRTKTLVTKRQVTREYGLVCLGRLVSVSRGEMDYFSAEGVTTAMEGCKSNALMRCCKDLGIASELWDPTFIRHFKAKYCDSKYYEKKRRYVWKLKSRPWDYPYNQ